MSTTFRDNVVAIIALQSQTSPEDFEQKPSGYARRAKALVFQLATHPVKAVRKAVAEAPLLSRTMVVAMFETEEDKAIKLILEPRYQAAISKADTLTSANARIKELEALLAKNNG